MLVRRCAVLLIEPREQLDIDLSLLFQGTTAIKASVTWIALAPHLDAEVIVDAAELAALGQVGETPWVDREWLAERIGRDPLRSLIAKGLIVSDDSEHAALRERDDVLRDTYWRPLSAVAHYFSRWHGRQSRDDPLTTEFKTLRDMVDKYGPPPAHFVTRKPEPEHIALAKAEASNLKHLLTRRLTCRNFDRDHPLSAPSLGALLHQVFACQALNELARESFAVKKTSPSAGGLHPIEAYLLVQNVQGVCAGLYHYHAGDHALEKLRGLEDTDARALAKTFVADQDYFADAQVFIALTARFKRNFWKYRNHPKAYRAIILDAGHLSQTLYLCATELGLGAFVTAAINEIDIERAFGLDPLVESPLAICGFGVRAARRTTLEFDPMNPMEGNEKP
jgi:putative peptide maturation dehydrogenase